MTTSYGFSDIDSTTTEYRNSCFHCGKDNRLILNKISFHKWYNGEALIQDCFPDLSADERELIMTGTHPECWKAVFG